MKRNNKTFIFLILSLFLPVCIIGIVLFYPVQDFDHALWPSKPRSSNEVSGNSSNNTSTLSLGSFLSPEIHSYLESVFAYTNNNTDTTSKEDSMKEETVAQNMIPANRTVYKDGFYYEPLSEEIKQRITGISYKENPNITYDDLRYVSILYVDFAGNTRTGELICNQSIAQDMVEIFEELYRAAYPIEKIKLIDEYGGDDDLSCADNNTSCFNYRVVGGTDNLSKHALGLAIDINPFYNPYITYPNGVERISPEGSEPYADRNSGLPHMILKDDLIYRLFTERGFTWGGEWKTLKDYQHFQKTP